MNHTRRLTTSSGNPPTPALIACQICRGANPMDISMYKGITTESIDCAKDLLINNVSDEQKEFVIAEYEKIEKMGMSIVVPPPIASKYGLNNEIVTGVMKLSFIIENISAVEKQCIAFKIISNEIGKDFAKINTNEDETHEKSSEESGYDAEEESTIESSDEAQLKE